MLLLLRPLFSGDVDVLPIDAMLDFSGVETDGGHPFRSPVSVKGAVQASAGVVTLCVTVSYTYFGQCDRCADPFERHDRLELRHILVTSLNHEDADAFILVEDERLALDELIRTDILLELPAKSLCRADCAGLCQECGVNLNRDPCHCPPKPTDPRLAALKELLSE